MKSSGFDAKEEPGRGIEQMGLFPGLAQRDANDAADRADQARRASWRELWGWEGPTVGGYGRIATIAPVCEDGRTLYAYTEIVRFIEERAGGVWLAEIAMGLVRGVPWPKDGRRVLLHLREIDPPYFTSADTHMRASHV